ncbi:MAG TPA: PQQ-dependent sugar dehydrogenase [Candidatus Paceibacterota bacterium]
MRKLLIILVALSVVGLYITIRFFNVRITTQQKDLEFIQLPEGFQIEVFADDLGGSRLSSPGPNPGPRLMELRNDTVFVALPSKGEIIAYEDKNKDAKPDSQKVFLSGLRKPHSIAFQGDWAYIAEEDRVIRVKDKDNDNIAEPETIEKIISLPVAGHWTRTAKIIDGSLYIALGSSCNVCRETDQIRSTIQKCDLDGKRCETFSRGLRNTVDFIQYQGKIYGTDNGRDGLGNTLPPDEINLIEKEKNYGWPICYGQNIHDTEFDTNTYIRNPCMAPFETPALVDLPAHVAPLGLAFYSGRAFPEFYRGKLFVAMHGSWDANPPVGYKIATIDTATKEITDFATGWFNGETVLGRPVGIINFRDGLLVSDDNAGKIYRIFYEVK